MLLVYLFSGIKIARLNFSSVIKENIQCIFIILAIPLLWISNASPATINAASCSRSHVQAAIDSASNGDTVLVPAGECTWTGSIDIGSKQITIIGAGIGETIITGGIFHASNNTGGFRISSFAFDTVGRENLLRIIECQNWRIDHCKFINDSGSSNQWDLMYTYGSTSTLLYGLFDNCEFENMRAGHWGEASPPNPPGLTRWHEDLNMGTKYAVYYEDNTFTGNIANGGDYMQTADANQGGRYVFRFNTVFNGYLEAHSVQGNNRGVRLFEVYNNTLDMESGYQHYKPMRPRGGTGVIWGNKLTGFWNHRHIAFDNVRSYSAPDPGGACDGNSPWDGNKDATGWPCRDQIGRSTDAFLWDGGYPSQESAPVYLWLNRDGEKIFSAEVINNSGDHIKNNRDYYDEAASFDGSSGTGYGTLASRPSTCTTGVAYWATDQGDWNKRGADGVLYQCTSTNKWELYYTPYTYPHPLRGPSAPQNLKITD